MMRCKQCSEEFPRAQAFDMWEVKRQFVQPDQTGISSHVSLEDAGVFCSRNCLRDYLSGGDRSGIFDLRRP